jgi:hypothetical protein
MGTRVRTWVATCTMLARPAPGSPEAKVSLVRTNGLAFDWVFVTIVAPVDLAALWVLGELLQVTGEDIALLWLVWAVRLDWDLAGEYL